MGFDGRHKERRDTPERQRLPEGTHNKCLSSTFWVGLFIDGANNGSLHGKHCDAELVNRDRQNISAEVSVICVYPFITTPATQTPSESFNRHVNISSLTRSSRSTCHNTRNEAVTHPSVYPFVFIRSDCECRSPRQQETDGAVSFIRSTEKRTRQFRPFGSSTVSAAVSRSGSGQRVFQGKPVFKEPGSWEQRSWPPKDQRSWWTGRNNERTLTSSPVPRPSQCHWPGLLHKRLQSCVIHQRIRRGGSRSSRLLMLLLRHHPVQRVTPNKCHHVAVSARTRQPRQLGSLFQGVTDAGGVAWTCRRSLTVPLFPRDRLWWKSAPIRLNKRGKRWEQLFALGRTGVTWCCKIW